jgi:catechol 2,3-dioxygenase-like lactoylglutathione lyase family enzyme
MNTQSAPRQTSTVDVPRAASPPKLAHAVLRTSRYEQMVDFYKKLFDAHATFESEMLTFLTYDEEHHRIALLNVTGLAQQKPGVAGVHHIAFTYASMADLISTYERVEKLGIEPVWCTNHGPTTSIYYRDPDGTQLELQVENFDTIEQSTAFFKSKAFAENPIGVDFDPAELARRLRSGEPESALKQRPDIGPRGFDASVKIY